MIFEGLMVDSVIRAFKRCEVIDFDDNVYPRRPEHGLVEVGSVQQCWICAKVRTADGQAYEITDEETRVKRSQTYSKPSTQPKARS